MARPTYVRTGAFILGGTDEIQTVLDDQIVKIQAMNASPFVKPFKERAAAWEATLQNLQVGRGNVNCHSDDKPSFHGNKRIVLMFLTELEKWLRDEASLTESGKVGGAPSIGVCFVFQKREAVKD